MLFTHRRALAVAAIVGVLSGAVLFNTIDETRFHGDESGWIASGNYYTELLRRGDLKRSSWECRECGAWGSLNMPLGKLLVAAPLQAMPRGTAASFSSYYDFEASLAENRARGLVPPADVLRRARAASAAFGVLCCLLAFLAGYLVHGIWAGATAALLLLFNRLFSVYATRAMTDVHYNVLLFCVAVTLIAVLQASGRRRQAVASAGAGVVTGLACSVKVTGILVGGLAFLLVIFYKTALHRLEKKPAFVSVIVFCGASLAVVYLLNPFFWPSVRTFDAKAAAGELVSLARRSPADASTAPGMRARYPQLANLAQVLEFPNLFPRWRQFMLGQTGMSSASWNGSRAASLHRGLFIDYATLRFELVFLVIGAALCARAVWTSARRGDTTVLAVPLICVAANYLLVVTALELNWDRYYLPTLTASRILVAIGLCETIRRAAARFGRGVRT